MELGSISSWVSAGAGLVVIAIGAVMFVVRQGTALEKSLAAAETAINDRINTRDAAIREKLELEVRAVQAVESKARNDAMDKASREIARVELELRTLQRESVRREEQAALETRLGTALGKLEGKVDRMGEALAGLGTIAKGFERLEEKVDRLTEQPSARRAAQ